jgi:translation initiation factor 1 (eIF-1/SUI1)
MKEEAPKPSKKSRAEGDDDEDEDEDDEEDYEEEEEVYVAPKSDKKEIIISVKERTRRKRITIVQGLDTCGLKSKDIAKVFSKLFATSASDTKEVGVDPGYMRLCCFVLI